MGTRRRQEAEKNRELIQRIVDKNFTNLWKELDPRIQEANRIPNYLNPERPSPRHIVLTLPKITDRVYSHATLNKSCPI